MVKVLNNLKWPEQSAAYFRPVLYIVPLFVRFLPMLPFTATSYHAIRVLAGTQQAIQDELIPDRFEGALLLPRTFDAALPSAISSSLPP